jgi:integrase
MGEYQWKGGGLSKEGEMRITKSSNAELIRFPQKRRKGESRKAGLNFNREGSVRNVNGKVYVDFMYLDERIRESSGLPWNDKNARQVRKQLDKIIVEINSGDFRFSEIFPDSRRIDFFSEKERLLFGRDKRPDEVLFKDYVWVWYELLKYSGRVSGRTLGGYKGYLNSYLIPFFGEKSFGSLNKILFDEFVLWAKKRRYRKKSVSNASIEKYLIPLRMICKDAAIKYGWGGMYDPFFGFKKPKAEKDAYEKIFPFSKNEQKKIITELPNHWKPFFRFAFASGISQGEQVALKLENIDWDNKTVRIMRAMTRDENGKPVEGPAKNKYRRRTIKLSPKMLLALEDQKKIYNEFKAKYFFCSPVGTMFDASNVRIRIWIPALKNAGVKYREMRQTRHSFATYHLSKGKNPLQIAKVMGHRNAEMVIKVYSRYIDDAVGLDD